MRQRYLATGAPGAAILAQGRRDCQKRLDSPPVGELDEDVGVVADEVAVRVADVIVVEAEEKDRSGAEDPAREEAAERFLVEEVVIDDGPEREGLAELVGRPLADDVVVPE